MGSQGGVLLKLMLLWLVLAAMAAAAVAASAAGQAKPGCQDSCGNVSIPYPFGTRKGCYLSADYLISCDNSTKPHKAFLGTGNINVTDITLKGELHVLKYISYGCYNINGTLLRGSEPSMKLDTYSVSGTLNKLVAVGCDTYAVLSGYQGSDPYTTGCMSICSSQKQVQDGSCLGVGCCQVSFPVGLKNIQVNLRSQSNHRKVWQFNPCSYAFVVEEAAFNFSSKNLTSLRDVKMLPMVVDWSIGNQTCQAARNNQSSYACKENSMCYESLSRSGYLCKCLDGYQGNPYLSHGCQDIDECEDPSLNKCVKKERCNNTPGNYTCSCPKGYHGDGRVDGDRCNLNRLQVLPIALGVGIGLVVLLVGTSWLYWALKQRKLIKLKEKFFQQNGGLMLQQQLSRREGSSEGIKILTAEELEKATDKYDECKIIGCGGYGTVYKGILADGRIVAIKKSKIVDTSQIEQFINEVLVLSQINHRNVVKLLGCCLETQVPLLVYEFITNGTLHDHIHNETKATAISWDIRLRIAAETAGVLSYLHSAASTPIIHRDVKSTNILLDDNYTAKVSDFGASKLVPIDQTQLSTMVQGTLGYLDPEYLHTSQLTEKSDVYSFGVVLVELLTGKKALSFDKPEEERSLALYFLSSLKNDRLFQVLENGVADKGNKEQIMKVAQLAKRCLSVKGDDRPPMKELAIELEGMRIKTFELSLKETDILPSMSSTDYCGSSANTTETYDSMKEQGISPMRSGR